jgi:hypothetical protein
MEAPQHLPVRYGVAEHESRPTFAGILGRSHEQVNTQPRRELHAAREVLEVRAGVQSGPFGKADRTLVLASRLLFTNRGDTATLGTLTSNGLSSELREGSLTIRRLPARAVGQRRAAHRYPSGDGFLRRFPSGQENVETPGPLPWGEG